MPYSFDLKTVGKDVPYGAGFSDFVRSPYGENPGEALPIPDQSWCGWYTHENRLHFWGVITKLAGTEPNAPMFVLPEGDRPAFPGGDAWTNIPVRFQRNRQVNGAEEVVQGAASLIVGDDGTVSLVGGDSQTPLLVASDFVTITLAGVSLLIP